MDFFDLNLAKQFPGGGGGSYFDMQLARSLGGAEPAPVGKWVINSDPLANMTWAHCGHYKINFTFGGIGYGDKVAVATRLDLDGGGPPDEKPYLLDISGVCAELNGKRDIMPGDYSNTIDGYVIVDGVYEGSNIYLLCAEGSAVPWGYGWTLNDRTITILGGEDANNPNLLDWLAKNATKIA